MINMSDITVFKRFEKKYFMTEAQKEEFLKRTADYMKADAYGMTTIMNIYFDNRDYDLIRSSIEAPVYKEKLRLRSYGIPAKEDKVFTEIKKKYDGIVYKRRAVMNLSEAEGFLYHRIKPSEDSQIIREIEYFLKFYNPEPKLFIAYDRTAYVGNEDPSFRATIDKDIRYRENDLYLEDGDSGKRVFEDRRYLLEIKVPGAFPLWMASILNDLQIYPVSFSKYGAIYKNIGRDIFKARMKENPYPVTEDDLDRLEVNALTAARLG